MGGNSNSKSEINRTVGTLLPALESLMFDITKYNSARSVNSKIFLDNMRAYMEYPNLAVSNLMVKNIFEGYRSYLGMNTRDFDSYTKSTLSFANDYRKTGKNSKIKEEVILFLSKMESFLGKVPNKYIMPIEI